VTLTNHGTLPLNIGGIRFTGPDAGDFAETNACGTRVRPGANCTISVTFGPQAKETCTAALSVTDSGGGSRQTVPLSGTGTQHPLSLAVGGPSLPRASLRACHGPNLNLVGEPSHERPHRQVDCRP
jgi:hypothetical protein